MSIKTIQDPEALGHPDLGQEVKVCGAVVTGIDENNGLFVQEQCAGPYSGIYVFQQGDFAPEGMAIGDKVDVVGKFDAYFGANQILLDTELASSKITKLSANNALPPAEFIEDTTSISTNCVHDWTGGAAQMWEGCRVRVEDVLVTKLDPCGQGQYGTFEVTEFLLVDDELGINYEPESVGDEIEAITGILHYAHSRFRLFPGSGDIEIEGGVPEPIPLPCTPIEDLQDPAMGADSGAGVEYKVCDVIVTAIDQYSNFFVQEAEGAEFSGIYVYTGGFDVPVGLAVGDVVDIRSTFSSYTRVNQLEMNGGGSQSLPQIIVKSSGATLPTPVSISDPSTVHTSCVAGFDGDDGYKYEGVRLKVSNVFVTSIHPCNESEQGVFEIDNSLWVDNNFGSTYMPTDTGDYLRSVVGVLHEHSYKYRLYPSEGDVIFEQSAKRKLP